MAMNPQNNHQSNNLSRNRDFFYEALIHSESNDPNRLEGRKKALFAATYSSLKPYLDFLSNAIKSEEKKTDYECNFKILKSHDSYKLEWEFPRYSISKNQLIPKIAFNIENIELKEEKNRFIFEDADKMITFSQNQAILSKDYKKLLSIANDSDWNDQISRIDNGDKVTLNGKEIDFSLTKIDLEKGTTFSQNDVNYTIKEILNNDDDIIFEIEQPKKGFVKTKDPILLNSNSLNIKPIIPKPEKLYFNETNKEWEFQKEDDEYTSEEKPQSMKLKDGAGCLYRLRPYENSKRGKNRAILQLLDPDDINEGEKTASDHFVENEMLQEIYQGDKKNTFKVQKIKTDERQLIVDKSNDNNELDPSLPIKMVIDTNNLKRQTYAIRTLLNSPVKEHRKLIQLFERKESVRWPQNSNASIQNWNILNDDKYNGVDSQREFVRKSMGSNDFMLLEGPPGSGKTTAILELILQLIAKDKRILLSASTHVAIDNILDKIKKHPEVVPLRLGREGSIGESVKEYLIDNKVKTLTQNGWNEEAAERFLLDSSNLVCGTTMGIQNHPDFRWKKNGKIVVPIYDVMIIDEASKTTFQEFIVPALYAKKWIIVGDIQQLAPYSETEYLKAHLTQCTGTKTQQMSVLAYLLNDLFNPRMRKRDFKYPDDKPYPLAIELPDGCTEEDFKKYSKRNCFESIPSNIAYAKGDRFFDITSMKEISCLQLYTKPLLLLEAHSLKRAINFIPETYNIISMIGTEIKESFKRRQSLYDKKSKYENRLVTQEDLKKFLNKEWASEVSWRLIRKFERRNLKESYYEKQLTNLIPENDEKIKDTIEDIEHIFFPSILELLQKGNKEKQKFETTLTKGFNQIDSTAFVNRFERLDYQHRMHPEISKFSREHFYGEERGIPALQDGKEIKREWEYDRYPSHAIWINVKRDDKYDKNNKQNKNISEKMAIQHELEKFILWAKNHPRQNEKWTAAVLTYYRPQETVLRDMLQKYTGQANHFSLFQKDEVEIQLHTVDKFQGREADIVFISMCRNKGVGFMDNTNRMNVALTRAKYQRVIVGDYDHFSKQHFSEELKMLARESQIFNRGR